MRADKHSVTRATQSTGKQHDRDRDIIDVPWPEIEITFGSAASVQALHAQVERAVEALLEDVVLDEAPVQLRLARLPLRVCP